MELSRSKKQVGQSMSKVEWKSFETWTDEVKNECGLESANRAQSSRELKEVHSWILRQICLHKQSGRESWSR